MPKKFSEDQAVDYIQCASQLTSLASLLLEEVTKEKGRSTKRVANKTGDALYWLWELSTSYLDESLIKKSIDKYE
jgi:hypothetical protein